MSDKKEKDVVGTESNQPVAEEGRGAAASRARNKTVMLSPEMTGEVREMLRQQGIAPTPEASPQPQADTSQFGGGQANAMDSLFSGPDRFETRSTSVIDTEGLGVEEYQDSESFAAEEQQDQGFDPMTSLVSNVPPLGSSAGQESVTDSGSGFMAEPTPAPAVEQPDASNFSVSAPPEAAPTPNVSTGSAPRKPLPSGPKGWHSIVSSRENKGRLVGLLISYDQLDEGEIFEIRAGRFLITSRSTDNGDYLLIDDESISPLHAIVRVTETGAIQVLDQLSEFGTGICKAGEEEEEEVAGGLATVEHGDTLRFGNRYFVVVSIPTVAKPE